MLVRCPWYPIVQVVFCLLRVRDPIEVFLWCPGGSSPDASSNKVACRRLCWMFSRCCLGVVPFTVDLFPFCVGLGLSVGTSCDRKYVLNVSFDIGTSS